MDLIEQAVIIIQDNPDVTERKLADELGIVRSQAHGVLLKARHVAMIPNDKRIERIERMDLDILESTLKKMRKVLSGNRLTEARWKLTMSDLARIAEGSARRLENSQTRKGKEADRAASDLDRELLEGLASGELVIVPAKSLPQGEAKKGESRKSSDI